MRCALLTKALRPLPDKFHGLADVEQRYRQRYVDPDRVARCPRGVRQALEDHPRDAGVAGTHGASRGRDADDALHPRWRDREAVRDPPQRARPGALPARGAGAVPQAPRRRRPRERVYEINRNFRNEGVSTGHNPEFTMLELYEAYATYNEIMDLTEGLIRDVAQSVLGSTALTWMARRSTSARRSGAGRWSTRCSNTTPASGARTCASRCHARPLRAAEDPVKRTTAGGSLLLEIFENTVEHTLVQPTFITDHPVEVSPLARASDSDPEIADRFELFVGGKELANGFSELNDPEDRAQRLPVARSTRRPAATTRPCISTPTTSARSSKWACPDRRPGHRHRQAGDADDRFGLDPRRVAVPVHAPGSGLTPP